MCLKNMPPFHPHSSERNQTLYLSSFGVSGRKHHISFIIFQSTKPSNLTKLSGASFIVDPLFTVGQPPSDKVYCGSLEIRFWSAAAQDYFNFNFVRSCVNQTNLYDYSVRSHTIPYPLSPRYNTSCTEAYILLVALST